MDIQDDSALASQALTITNSGDNNGQIALGGTIIQVGEINDGQVNLFPGTSSGNSTPAGDDPALPLSAAEREQLAALRQILSNSFDDGELRDLVFDLAVDYDSLPGAAKKDKARELVAFCRRHGRLAELKLAIQRRRPRAFAEGAGQTRPE